MNYVYVGKVFDSNEDAKHFVKKLKEQLKEKKQTLLYKIRGLCLIYIIVPMKWDELLIEADKRRRRVRSFYA